MSACENPGCGNADGSKRCTGCTSRVYCSRGCQKDDWEEHSYECNPKAPPLSFGAPHLRRSRPRVSSPAEFVALVDEVKRTYYPGAVSPSPEAQCSKDGVPQGYIVISSANVGTWLEDYSAEQLNRHMILILTKKRQKMTKRFVAAIVGKKEANNPSSTWIGSELAPNVSRAFRGAFLPQYSAATNTRFRFDLLYGFTAAIYQYWFWMRRHPYGWDGHGMLETLAFEWRDMLGRSPEDLGVDPVFSFPALREFVRKFRIDLEEEECGCPFPLLFDYE